jgi:hypothetical protein
MAGSNRAAAAVVTAAGVVALVLGTVRVIIAGGPVGAVAGVLMIGSGAALVPPFRAAFVRSDSSPAATAGALFAAAAALNLLF